MDEQQTIYLYSAEIDFVIPLISGKLLAKNTI